MKRLLPLLLMLLFLMPALAEDDPTALFLEAHPGYTIDQSSACGNTAAAILVHEEDKILCVAERLNGAWTLTVDNPHAIKSDGDTTLLLDTDSAIFWNTQMWPDQAEAYAAYKSNDTWQLQPPVYFSSRWDDNHTETILTWLDGTLFRTRQLRDPEDNLLFSEDLMPLPAAWMTGIGNLATFDVEQFPSYFHDWPTDAEIRAIAEAAKALLPAYTFIGGSLSDQELQLLMDKPDGTRVFVGVTYDGNWHTTESTPLPKDTIYGYENFQDYLYIEGYGIIGVKHWPDGSWGINFLSPNGTSFSGMYILGQNYFSDGYFYYTSDTMLIGDHPWKDITAIDWTKLPNTFDDARAAIDNSGWAVVNNPNPADRLHLREKPDRSAASKGKYYNGTPVRVLEKKGDWTRVDVYGIEGWMMTSYLAFGNQMEAIERALPGMAIKEAKPYTTLYQTPGGKALRTFREDVRVLGIVGDEWFHVMLNNEETGYVQQADFWPGNG